MDDERTARLDQFCIVTEAFEISLLGTIDVEVIRICRCDDAHPWAQPVETAVKLICLDDYEVALVRENVVGAIVLGDSSEEGIAVEMALVHDVGTHGRSRSLAVCTCHAQSLVGAGQGTKNLRTLLDGESILAEVNQLLVLSRDGWCIDNQRISGILASLRDEIYILFVVDEHSFFLQLVSEIGRSLVVSGYNQLLAEEVSGDGAHTDAACTYKINCFNILDFHYLVANLITSSAMMSAEFFNPNFLMFSQSELSLSSFLTVLMAFWSNSFGASASFT